jgi:DNA polymerase
VSIDPAFVELYEEIADCPNCALARKRTQTVPGTGPLSAEIMLIGEAPGAREDDRGEPFVGPSGKFLDELLASVGLSRDTVYICNVVKCRPPENRDPAPDEIAACQSFLDRQIEMIDPKLIVTLGRFSMKRWFSGTTISRVHGRPKRVDGRLVIPMYHPAAALHRGSLRGDIEADFARLPELLEQVREGLPSSDAESTPAAPIPVAVSPPPREPVAVQAAQTTSTTEPDPNQERLL